MTDRDEDPTPAKLILIVDGANVVGSRADGWWRDRAGANERLRDRLAALGGVEGLPEAGPGIARPEIILVTEGAARGVPSVPGVRVVAAPGSGDDTIALLAVPEADESRTVVTADRELRRRAESAGASVVGPRWLLDRLG
jgi:8-oxo-dGTP diphosphatase